MHPLARVAALLAFLSSFLIAQEAAPDAVAAPPALEVSLAAASGVVKVGHPLVLDLSIKVNADSKLPASAIGGIELESSIDGKKATTVREAVSGAIQVAAGTTIRRSISIDVEKQWPAASLRDKKQLALRWVGLDGAETVVPIVPDQSALDLATLDLGKTRVRFLTSKGEIVIGFMPDQAPRHVENFIKLSRDGFYHGTRFHRIIKGFMIQGGCPNTKLGATGQPGTGGPGWAVRAEFNDTKHQKGIVSMARSSGEDTAGSQFFLVHGAAPHLDGQYSAFGIIEQGLEVLDLIAETPVMPSRMGETSVPAEDIWLFAAIVEPVFKE